VESQTAGDVSGILLTANVVVIHKTVFLFFFFFSSSFFSVCA
jgi:hypothetical protein